MVTPTMRLFSFLVLSFGVLLSTAAVPSKRDVSDVDVLNFALTLEHLESTYYHQGLAKYSNEDFVAAGFPTWARGRVVQIAKHEQSHVDFLVGAIKAAGASPVEACQYAFPDKDAKSFIDVAELLESVGTSAYNGASKLITNKEYLTAAASVLSTEARHAAFLNSALRKRSPWSTPYETPLDINQVYTLASSFITSCPSTNAKLPARAYTPLSLPATAAPGARVALTIPAGTTPVDAGAHPHAAFLTGLTVVYVPVEVKGQGGKKEEYYVTIPGDLKGTVYVLLTRENGKVDEGSVVAGPAVAMFGFDSSGNEEA